MEKIEDLIHDLLIECGEVGYLTYEKGWAEANAGNLSIRLNEDIFNKLNDKKLEIYSNFELKSNLSNLNGRYFLVKGSGKRMRDIKKAPEQNLCIGKINNNLFQVIWPPNCNFKPTSEIETHLTIHNFLIKNKPEYTSILHTHPTDVINYLNMWSWINTPGKEFYEVTPNMSIYLPEGIGILQFEIPSSLELALKTLELIKYYRIILLKQHGTICVEHSLMACFDLIDIVNKASYSLINLIGHKAKFLSKKQINDLKSSYKKMD